MTKREVLNTLAHRNLIDPGVLVEDIADSPDYEFFRKAGPDEFAALVQDFINENY